jgi:hypothetical protein
LLPWNRDRTGSMVSKRPIETAPMLVLMGAVSLVVELT